MARTFLIRLHLFPARLRNIEHELKRKWNSGRRQLNPVTQKRSEGDEGEDYYLAVPSNLRTRFTQGD
jgi:hypothetical protein